jgi:hypothetical protein
MVFGQPSSAAPIPGALNPEVLSWLRSAGWQRAEALVWGAHGGAGTCTLALRLHAACDMGAMRPGMYPRYPALTANGRPLIIVCRATAQAAQAATTAVAAVTRARRQVAALAVVSDGWPEPATATTRLRLLQARVGAIVTVPFVPGLRLADDAPAVPLPHRARRALDQIRAAAGLPSHVR